MNLEATYGALANQKKILSLHVTDLAGLWVLLSLSLSPSRHLRTQREEFLFCRQENIIRAKIVFRCRLQPELATCIISTFGPTDSFWNT